VTVLLAGLLYAAEEKNRPDTVRTARLFLRGIPEIAEVFINGSPAGKTFSKPFSLNAGIVELRVKTGDAEIMKSFSMQPGDRRIFNFKNNPDYASVDIISDPLKAEVYLNEKKIGLTPCIDSLITPGTYVMEVNKAGYDPVTRNFTLLPQEEVELTFTMRHSQEWLDSVAEAESIRHRRIQFAERFIFGIAGIAMGGAAWYCNNTARQRIDKATMNAQRYDLAREGFQTYKDQYYLHREAAKRDINRRNILIGVASGAAAGFVATFVF
jgi:hypothetical protein